MRKDKREGLPLNTVYQIISCFDVTLLIPLYKRHTCRRLEGCKVSLPMERDKRKCNAALPVLASAKCLQCETYSV